MPYDFCDLNGTPLLEGDLVSAVEGIPKAGVDRGEVMTISGLKGRFVEIRRRREELVLVSSALLELV